MVGRVVVVCRSVVVVRRSVVVVSLIVVVVAGRSNLVGAGSSFFLFGFTRPMSTSPSSTATATCAQRGQPR